MKAVMKLSNPDELSATVTMTATVKEWRQVKEALEQVRFDSWTVGDLSIAIRDIVNQAETHFHSGPV